MGEYDNSKVRLVSGISLPCHEEGVATDDSPLLLLLHGLNAHSGTWRKNIPFFAHEKRVVAPSLPPWHTSIPLDITNYVGYIDELLSNLRTKSISIIGNSMGGWIGMKLMEVRPRLVKRLILEDTAGASNPIDEKAIETVNDSKVPVLIVWGKDDPRIPLDVAYFLHSKIENSEIFIFDKTGHVPHWERPDEFNELVASFLGKGTK